MPLWQIALSKRRYTYKKRQVPCLAFFYGCHWCKIKRYRKKRYVGINFARLLFSSFTVPVQTEASKNYTSDIVIPIISFYGIAPCPFA